MSWGEELSKVSVLNLIFLKFSRHINDDLSHIILSGERSGSGICPWQGGPILCRKKHEQAQKRDQRNVKTGVALKAKTQGSDGLDRGAQADASMSFQVPTWPWCPGQLTTQQICSGTE
jgi:hypothetical protein